MSETPRGTSADDGPGDQTAPERDGGGPTRNRRRRSRGGRNRNRGTGDTGGSPSGQSGSPSTAVAAADDRRPDDLPDRPQPVRGQAPSGQSADASTGPKVGDRRPAPLFIPKFPPPGGGATAGEPGGDEEGGPPARRRRRRGGRGKGPGRSPGEEDGSAAADEEVAERRRGRERKGRPVGRYLMCVHVKEDASQIAVLEGRSLIEHYVSRPQDDATEIDGNIYLGRVQNVLPGMEAAFVDIGTPKNAVLYRGDVRYDREDLIPPNGGEDDRSADSSATGGRRGDGSRGNRGGEARIEHLLRPGQTILCQVTKNPIGTKGARLTQEVSLPGRFVVLIPNSETYGISKRLPDDERRRLRRLLDDVRPEGHGLIVRTAAEGATGDELARDVDRLLGQWEQIDAKTKKAKVPALLYREPGMAVRVIREEFNADYRNVLIDDRELYEDVRAYVASISPELADRVEYFDEEADGLPLFERHHIHEQLHKALDRKVWLPSGGSIIVDRTEALTVIDVNTGKNVGKSSLEETVYRNNLEAAEEIARQLRLRDIGGIIVIDFIDMEVAQNRADVITAFRDALARDKTRTQVFDISELGLVQMTRKRVSEGLVESFSSTCPTCAGRGIVLDETLL